MWSSSRWSRVAHARCPWQAGDHRMSLRVWSPKIVPVPEGRRVGAPEFALRIGPPAAGASVGARRARAARHSSTVRSRLEFVVCRAERPEIAHVVERARVAVVGRPVVDDEALGRPAVLAAPAVATLDGQDRPLPLRGAVARIAGAAPRGSAARAEPGAAAEHDAATRRADATTADHRRGAPIPGERDWRGAEDRAAGPFGKRLPDRLADRLVAAQVGGHSPRRSIRGRDPEWRRNSCVGDLAANLLGAPPLGSVGGEA